MNSQLYLYEITRYLAAFTSQVKIENQNGNFDINKYSESFLIPILNVVFKNEFERLELAKVNYPAVDLRSKDKKICVQVTSEIGFAKIRDTLSGFISHKLYEDSELIHLVIDEDYATQKTNAEIAEVIQTEVDKLQLKEPPKINFTRESIWNISAIRKEIEKKCSVSQLKDIRDFLKSQYGDVTSLPTFTDVLIPYQVVFESQLKPESSNLPFQFNNPFFGREEDLKSLTDFINSEKESLLTLVADGGYGKTRLCIEFFQKIVDASGDTEAFVLNDKAFQGQIFPSQTLPSKKTIILVDDAHKKTEILDGLLAVVMRYKNVKLILTVRKALYEDTVKAFSTHSRNIPSVPLKRLSYDNTLGLIKSQVPRLSEVERKRLAEQSKGVPIVILGLCQIIRRGKYSSEISEEENFIRFVRELKDQVISDISTKYYLDDKNVNKTIQLIGLLGPLKNTQEEISILANLNSITYEECSMILSYLEEHEFIQQKTFISILSDPYSDIILLDMAPRIKFILRAKGIEKFTDRIIRNLVQVEHSERLGLNVDSIIIEFISSIAKNPLSNYQEIEELNNNLETLKHFAFKKPLIVFKAVELILKMTEENTDFWLRDSSGWNFSRVRETHGHLDAIIAIIALNSHNESELSNVLILIREFIKRRSDFSLLAIAFRYREYDFYEYRYFPKIPCERQQFLIKTVREMVSAETLREFDSQFILSGVTTLLRLDFEIEQLYDKYKHTFSYGTAQVVDNEVTNKIRNEATHILISLFNKTRNTETGNKTYETILRLLHFTASPNQKGGYVLNQSSQVTIVAKFLFELMADNPSIEERAKLLRQLQLYSRRETKPEYIELNQKLSLAAGATKNQRERIEILLREEYFVKKEHLEGELKKTIAEYKDWVNFYEDAVVIRNSLKGTDVQYFNELLEFLVANHSDQSKELFEFVSEKYPDLTIDFCELVRANHKDKEYFYSKIKALWAINTESAKQAVIYLLTIGRKRDKTQYEKGDLAYIETAIDEGNQGAMFRLSVTLPDFMDLDSDLTLKLCKKFIDSDKGRNIEMLITSLFEAPDFTSKHKDKLNQFAFSTTIQLQIDSHYFNFIFLFLERNFGFDVLFSYMLKRIEFLENEVGWHSIDFSGVHNNSDLTPEQRDDNFVKVIQWYLSVDQPSPYVHLKLVEYFLPARVFTQSLVNKLKALAAQYANNIDALIGICKALDVYGEKEGELLEFLISMANGIVKLKGCKKDKIVEVLGEDFVFNNGGKSKSGPGPYPKDIARRELLIEALKKYEMEKDVREIFESALLRVEESIKWEEKTASEEW